MKLLVTADLHLSESQPERLEVFRWLIEQAVDEQADGLLIGGDIFDSTHDFEVLKGEFLSALKNSTATFPVITIPGNHDSELSSRTYLGENTNVLDEDNKESTISAKGLNITISGLPYHHGTSKESDQRNIPEAADEGTSIFLTHGSLIDPEREYIFDGISRQQEENDNLIFRRDFEGLNYDCVILGHWHGSSHFRGDETDFLYPGSPLPTSRRDLGQKFYWILTVTETNSLDLTRRPITADSSWYYQKESLFAIPNYKKEVPDRLYELLDDIDKDPRRSLIVEINGFVSSRDELELKGELDEVTRGFEGNFQNVELVWNLVATDKFEEPLVSNFIGEIEKLDKSDVDLESFLGSTEGRYARIFNSLVNDELEQVKQRILEGSLQVFSDRLN